jgi:cell division protease FtsH
MYGTLRNFGLWLLIVLLLLALFSFFQNPAQRSQNPAQRSPSREIAFSEFLDMVDRGNVRAVEIEGPEIRVSTIGGETFRTFAPNDPNLVPRLRDKRVVITVRSSQPSRPHDTAEWVESLVISWAPFLFLVGAWIFLARWMRRRGAALLDFGRRPAAPAPMVDDPAHWRGRAGEARVAADQLADPESQRQMLEIAERYEYLAQRPEERRRRSGS